MLAVKGSTVESSLLCLTTDLWPSAVKTCKWTEKASTTSRFVNLFDDLIELTEHDDSKVVFNTSRQFKSKSIPFSQQWDVFVSLHGLLQEDEEDGLARNKGQKLIIPFTILLKQTRRNKAIPSKIASLEMNTASLGTSMRQTISF
jgi:hypothetical protein